MRKTTWGVYYLGRGGTFSIRGKGLHIIICLFSPCFHQANWWETNSRRRQWQNVKEYIERVWHCQFIPLLNPGSCELALNSEWFERMYTSTAHKTDIEVLSVVWRAQNSNIFILIWRKSWCFDLRFKGICLPSFRFLQTHENNVLPITWITQWQNLSRG